MSEAVADLEKQISIAELPEERIDAVNKLSWLKRRNDIDESYRLANEALDLSLKHQYRKGEAYAKFCLAFHDFTSQGNIKRSIQVFLEVIEMFREIGDDFGRGMAHSLVSFVYWTTSDYENGFNHLLEGEIYQEKSGNKEGMAWDQFNFGTYYAELNSYDEALPRFEKSLVLFKEVNEPFGQASAYNGLAQIYRSKNNYEMAVSYCERSIQIANENNFHESKAWALKILSEVYLSEQDFEQAIDAAEESLRIYESIGDKQGIVNAKLDLGVVYCVMGDQKEAIEYLEYVDGAAEEVENYTALITAHQHMAHIYETQQNVEKTLEHTKKYIRFKERLMGDASANQMQKMQAIFNVKQARQETEIERLRNVELAAANREIQLQKDKILSSIRYAKRIQDSILSSVTKLNLELQEAFLFFRPRDIVSGDFYWFNRVGDDFVLAAIDCTGHGVPGAFMTLLGNSLLNNIILRDQITEPEQILYELDRRLLNALSNDPETKANDGMDMAVVTINDKKKTMHFAGAKNPLVIVRNGEAVQVKGSKFPIGSYQFRKPKKFDRHTVEYREDDIFYIYSDGYPDQFDESNRNKYLSKRFRQFLLDISTKPMDQQPELLGKELDQWIGSGIQTDDIIVIGFKLNE
jgi:serine phosphatase RsbU (regulator of sigma subunit)